MASIILKLDCRRATISGQYPIKLLLSHNSQTTSIGIGITIHPDHWVGDINRAVTAQCPNSKQLNADIEAIYFKHSNALRELEISGKISEMNITEVRNTISTTRKPVIKKMFVSYFEDFIDKKDRENTVDAYRHTLSKIKQYAIKIGRSDNWRFEDITLAWIRDFEQFLKTQHLDEAGKENRNVHKLTINGIRFHLINLRAVINAAIDEDLTAIYPFRKFKIKREETAKRSLTVDQLRALRDYSVEPHQEKYRDLFMLIFYLVGINTIDLFSLKEIHNGRLEYRRSKTGRLFSIKVEPEAQAIIDKYRGENQLLDVLDTYANYKDFAHRMNLNLRQIGEVERKGQGGKKHRSPLFSGLTTYWARHTWATVAAELDIPDETISLALGHSSGNRVTNIYINRNQKKVDEANRKVIDHVAGISAPSPVAS